MTKLTYEAKQAVKAAKRKAWLAAPIAFVERPLRYLAIQLNTYNEKGDLMLHPIYRVAARHAAKGNGKTARDLAYLHANQ